MEWECRNVFEGGGKALRIMCDMILETVQKLFFGMMCGLGNAL